MANFNLDRLKFRFRGEWTSNQHYLKDDIVYYEGKAYVCQKGHITSDNFYLDRDANLKTEVFNVTVDQDTINNQEQGKFYINGEENPELFLLKGRTYRFNQNDISNLTFNAQGPHILRISNTENGTLAGAPSYNEGVVYYLNNQVVDESIYIENFRTSSVRYIEVTLPETAPPRLFYFGNLKYNMGSAIDSRYDSYWTLMLDGYTWRGDWQGSAFYPEGSIVKFKGNTYQAVVAHTAQPVDVLGLAVEIDKWILYTENTNWLNLWTENTIFEVGDVVRYNGRTYICNTRHTSSELTSEGLEVDEEKWSVVSRSDNWRSDWSTNVRYIQDDLVKYGGIVYRCLEGHTSTGIPIDGLELDQDKWEIVVDGIEYKTDWSNSTRYKVGDIVKYGASLWKCNTGHTSTDLSTNLRGDQEYWDIWVPGLEYERIWQDDVEYQVGDIVLYGGYTYTALTNNFNSIPSVNGKVQDTGDWEALTTGYNHRGEWDSEVEYKTGDVVRLGGYLYIAITDNFDVYPDSDVFIWTMLVDSVRWQAEWADGVEYLEGDVVTLKGTTYQCIRRHISTFSLDKPDLDLIDPAQNYWVLLIQGSPNNVLERVGDIRTHESDIANLPIGSPGTVLKSTDVLLPGWLPYDEIDKVFYVSTDGRDIDGFGTTLSAPFRTVKYACDYILQDIANRTPATIFIKTGLYEEILPISVPPGVALVGDELRSTRIAPATGYETSNMFYVRNGSGIRNMTLQGLNGELGNPNEYLTRRPTAGAFVSLDPGEGPDDENVWITTRSCYVQNVTTFGTGCIGMKVDGALHSGGNRSIVANDFTQVLSDGIGYWADNVGRSELVSVFTYYCHIGYLCTNGGILRATNGNNSYGTYGSVAEGFDQNENPITAKINNQDNEAQFSEGVTYGTTKQEIIAIGYSHAGQDYVANTTSITYGGSGQNAAADYTEVRNGAISNIRVKSLGDSSAPGGLNYTLIANNAQSGDNLSITLAQADITEEPAEYIGQRIRIASGLGVGQYAEITNYDPLTKEVIVSKESDGSTGWDHFYPGWPIENVLDETTVYVIEPRVVADEPVTTIAAATGPQGGSNYKFVVAGPNSEILAVTDGLNANAVANLSVNGGDEFGGANSIGTQTITGLVYTGNRYIALRQSSDNYIASADGIAWGSENTPFSDTFRSIATDGNGTVIIVGESGEVGYSTNDGQSWSTTSISGTTSQLWGPMAYGHGKYVVMDTLLGDVAITKDDGVTWELILNATTDGYDWKDITYGNGRFVAITDADDSSGNLNRTAYSFDGENWYESIIEASGSFTNVSYGAGVFVATGPGNLVALSQDGRVWKTFGEDSTAFATTRSANWSDSVYTGSKWLILDYDGGTANTVTTGARPIIRLKVENSRAGEFVIYDPGSNYTTIPDIQIFDNSNTSDTNYQVYLNDGVLAQPEYSNRGEGYVTLTAEIEGDGFAEIYQLGNEIKVTGLDKLPGPGANLDVLGIDDRRYSVSAVLTQSGDEGDYTATLQIVPSFDVDESPDHETDILIRERYSQVRLTGHDFLDIGTGNFNTTRYPNLYVFGEDSENERQPFNETVAFGGGRVFYTSTDQNGNFRVGELFEVEQDTGIVTVNADYFDLDGLSELSLGGIQVGGSAVVIREFTTDPFFTANSNNAVPTEAAIKAYVESRISGGGSNASTNTLVAGQVRITSNRIDTTSDLRINVPVVTNFKKGIKGHYLAVQFFSAGGAI